MEKYNFLVYNKTDKTFFEATGVGDRYATCFVDCQSKYPKNNFFVCGQVMTMEDYKDIFNAWLTPDGRFIPVPFGRHEEFAWDFLFATEEDERFSLKINGYAYEELLKRGWMRFLTWTRKDSRCVGNNVNDRPNSEQKQTLEYWCGLNDFEYENLFID